MLGRGDLRWLLLARIAEEPCHGYELIRRVSELFAGTTRPARAWCTRPWRSWKPPAGWPRQRRRAAPVPHHPAGQAEVAAASSSTRCCCAPASAPAGGQGQPAGPGARTLKHRRLHRRHGRWSEADIARVAAAMERVAEALERDGDD
jgi:hypothetical protein